MDRAHVRAAAARIAHGRVTNVDAGLASDPDPDPVSKLVEALKRAEYDICLVSFAEANGDVVPGTSKALTADLNEAVTSVISRVAMTIREADRILASTNTRRRTKPGD